MHTARWMSAAALALLVACGRSEGTGSTQGAGTVADDGNGHDGKDGNGNGNGNGNGVQAFCTQCVNPAGKNIPAAGFADTCIEGEHTAPNAGMNPDGFYQVGATGGGDVDLYDAGNGCALGATAEGFFGTFDSATNIKYTEAGGPRTVDENIGGPNSAVDFKIKGQGDLWVCPEGATTGEGGCVCCLVPQPPK